MKQFVLAEGLLISYQDTEWELIGRSTTELTLEAVNSGEKMLLTEDEFHRDVETGVFEVLSQAVVTDKEIRILHLDEVDLAALTPQAKARHDKKTKIVESLLDAGVTRGKRNDIEAFLLKNWETLELQGNIPAASTVSGWMKRFEEAGNLSQALVSGHVFRKSSKRLPNSHEELIEQVIDDWYMTLRRNSIHSTFQHYLVQLKNFNARRLELGEAPYNPVSENTIKRRIAGMSFYDKVKARKGKAEADRATRMVKGVMRSNFPLEWAEIDHTPLNVFAMDDVLWLPLGRPWLTTIKDRFSGVILGFYISFNQGGLQAIYGALRHSVTAHAYIRQWDGLLENDWPCWGFAQHYAADRGKDFMSENLRYAVRQLGSRLVYAPPRTPIFKAAIERFFGTLESRFLESLPGKTFPEYQKRFGYKPQKDVVLRFSTLVFLLHKYIVDEFNLTPHSRSLARPLDIWNEYIGDYPPPYAPNVDKLDCALGLERKAVLCNEGLRFRWLSYADADGRLGELRRKYGKLELTFRVSPADLGRIHVIDPETKGSFIVPCTRPEYADGLSLIQHDYIRTVARERLTTVGATDVLLKARTQLQESIAEEIERNSNPTKAKLARASNINSMNVLAGKAQSVSTPFENSLLVDPYGQALPALNTESRSNTASELDELTMEEEIAMGWGDI